MTQNYITPFALTMQATTQQIGYLSSLPNFAIMLMSLFAPVISERVGHRKNFILATVLFMALMWLPILAIPYLFHTGGLVMLIASFVAAGLLQLLTGNTRLAFTIIFLVAMTGRFVSIFFLARMYDPHPVLPANPHKESIPQIMRGLFSTNIGRFMIFIVFLNLAQNIDAPFFSAYLLEELHKSYISYQLITATMAVTAMLVVVWWGKRADKAGRIKVLHITALMIPFISLLWLVNSSVAWLCAVQVYSGFAWAGFNLCASMFIWDAAPQENRTRYISLFGALSALGFTLGALIGGNLGPNLPKISGSYFLTLFLVAGIVKLIVVLGLFRRISEVRNVQPIKATDLLFGDLNATALTAWWRRINDRSRR